ITLLIILLQIVCVLVALAYPNEVCYLSATNIGLRIKAIPSLALMTLGVGILMITSDVALSVGSVYTLASYVAAIVFTAGYPVLIAVGCALLVGIVIGVINGLITVRAAIPSFITTMGSMLVVRGIVRWLSESGSVSFRPSAEVA